MQNVVHAANAQLYVCRLRVVHSQSQTGSATRFKAIPSLMQAIPRFLRRRHPSSTPPHTLTHRLFRPPVAAQIKALHARQQEIKAKMQRAQADLDTWRAQVEHIHSQWQDTQAKNARLRADNEAISAAIAREQAAARSRAANSNNTLCATGATGPLQPPPAIAQAVPWACPSPTATGGACMPLASAASAEAGRAGGMWASSTSMYQCSSSTASPTMLPRAGSCPSSTCSHVSPAAAAAAAAAAHGAAPAPAMVPGHSMAWCGYDEQHIKGEQVQAVPAAGAWAAGEDSLASDVWYSADHSTQRDVGAQEGAQQPWEGHLQLDDVRVCGSSGSASECWGYAGDTLPKAYSSNDSCGTVVAGGAGQNLGEVSPGDDPLDLLPPGDDPLDLLLADDTRWGSGSLEELMELLTEDAATDVLLGAPAKHTVVAELQHASAAASLPPQAPGPLWHLPSLCGNPSHLAAPSWGL
jgi:hypothetical protein